MQNEKVYDDELNLDAEIGKEDLGEAEEEKIDSEITKADNLDLDK